MALVRNSVGVRWKELTLEMGFRTPLWAAPSKQSQKWWQIGSFSQCYAYGPIQKYRKYNDTTIILHASASKIPWYHLTHTGASLPLRTLIDFEDWRNAMNPSVCIGEKVTCQAWPLCGMAEVDIYIQRKITVYTDIIWISTICLPEKDTFDTFDTSDTFDTLIPNNGTSQFLKWQEWIYGFDVELRHSGSLSNLYFSLISITDCSHDRVVNR